MGVGTNDWDAIIAPTNYQAWPGQASTTNVIDGYEYRLGVSTRVYHLDPAENLAIQIFGVDCDNNALLASFLDAVPGLRSLFDWGCGDEEGNELSGDNDHIGNSHTILGPSESIHWAPATSREKTTTVVLKGPTDTECSDQSAYTATFVVESRQVDHM
jgi:hypothetical protein